MIQPTMDKDKFEQKVANRMPEVLKGAGMALHWDRFDWAVWGIWGTGAAIIRTFLAPFVLLLGVLFLRFRAVKEFFQELILSWKVLILLTFQAGSGLMDLARSRREQLCRVISKEFKDGKLPELAAQAQRVDPEYDPDNNENCLQGQQA